MSRGIKLLMNQLSHRVPLLSPMIRMVSFSLVSFSYTIPLIITATEYIQARVVNRGRDWLKTRRNLRSDGRRRTIYLFWNSSNNCWVSELSCDPLSQVNITKTSIYWSASDAGARGVLDGSAKQFPARKFRRSTAFCSLVCFRLLSQCRRGKLSTLSYILGNLYYGRSAGQNSTHSIGTWNFT